jgi:hypothetical protein
MMLLTGCEGERAAATAKCGGLSTSVEMTLFEEGRDDASSRVRRRTGRLDMLKSYVAWGLRCVAVGAENRLAQSAKDREFTS